MALPPDNKFQQGTATFGYNFTDTTRVSADVAIGRMSQNDTFLALTLDPVIAASITEPLPRNSLEGEINTTVINLRLSSRPTRQFHWGASRSEEHTTELQSLMRTPYAVFCLK